MTNFTITDGNFNYDVTTNCGRPSQIVRRRTYGDAGDIVELDDLPFLIQTRIEATLAGQFPAVPRTLFRP